MWMRVKPQQLSACSSTRASLSAWEVLFFTLNLLHSLIISLLLSSFPPPLPLHIPHLRSPSTPSLPYSPTPSFISHMRSPLLFPQLFSFLPTSPPPSFVQPSDSMRSTHLSAMLLHRHHHLTPGQMWTKVTLSWTSLTWSGKEGSPSMLLPSPCSGGNTPST